MYKNVLLNSLAIGIGALFIFYALHSSSQEGEATVDVEVNEEVYQKPADSIEVVHFRGTMQCWSCVAVGEYALKTITEKFPEEYAQGTIVFKEINGELPENRDIVMKYRARGSSLFVNAIIEGEDTIEEEVQVWRLVSNEARFIAYFEERINTLLGR